MFYTDQPADLNADELSRYHVLILYNNHTNVTRPQLNALLSFVQNGGGLVVLHCASASFQNSEEFIRLVGAAFKSHGTGVFKATTIAPNHAVMRGVSEFEAWDETYIHTKHNPNRTVLAVRREGNHEEPWTWVREYGKGRVFYTAAGHDQRVWGTDGFQQLVDNAIKWIGRRFADGQGQRPGAGEGEAGRAAARLPPGHSVERTGGQTRGQRADRCSPRKSRLRSPRCALD